MQMRGGSFVFQLKLQPENKMALFTFQVLYMSIHATIF